MKIHRNGTGRAFAIAIVTAALVNGCGPMQYRAGRPFDPALLEQKLQVGKSGEADVRALLGEPYGQGKAMMPYQDSPRKLWSYFYDQATIDIGSGRMESQRRYLFVFFAGDRLDSYMWFNGDLR
jgi:hypothetical protein